MLACISPTMANAQVPAVEVPQAERVIVTGERLPAQGQNAVTANGALGNKALLDTPYSLTVVDQEDLAKRQVTTIGQIFANDPAFFSFASAGTVNWWGAQIRGLGVRNYYVDDVPLLLYWGGDFPLESIASVEALKGLSGFMYGFGAPGGVISYRTKRPPASPLLTAELGYRSGGDAYLHVDAGGHLGDGGLGYRVNLAGEKGTLYNDAVADRSVASAAFEYEFDHGLKAWLTATSEQSRLEREPFQVYWSSYTGSVLPRVTYDYAKLNVENTSYQTRTLASAAGLDWQFHPDWSARLTYGYTRKLHHSNKTFIDVLDQEGNYQGHVYNFAELDKNQFAQAMVLGAFETGPVRHQVVAGAALQVNDSDFGLNDYYYGDDFTGNLYQDQPFRITRPVNWSTDGGPYDERQRALFLSDTLHFGDQVQAILGARYTRYRLLDGDGDPAVDSGYRTSATSPTIALIYKPAAFASIYASHVEAMEPGSRVSGEYANAGDILKATVSKQDEVGVKLEHQGLSVTAAAFRIERANTIDRLRDGLRYLTQDGLTLYKGVEAMADYRFRGGHRIGFGAIHLDASLQNVSPENADLIGNVPGEAARQQYVGHGEYLVAAVPGLALHGNVRYYGRAPTDDTNALYIPARTLVNVGFEYETQLAGRAIVFVGNVNNLFDTKYWGLGNFGEGRNASLSARLEW